MSFDQMQGGGAPQENSEQRRKAEIIFQEFLDRRKSGEMVEPEQYIFWYPELQKEFKALLQELEDEGLVDESVASLDATEPESIPADTQDQMEPDPGEELESVSADSAGEADPEPAEDSGFDLAEPTEEVDPFPAEELESDLAGSTGEVEADDAFQVDAESPSPPQAGSEPEKVDQPLISSELGLALEAAPDSPPEPATTVGLNAEYEMTQEATAEPASTAAAEPVFLEATKKSGLDAGESSRQDQDAEPETAEAPGSMMTPEMELALKAAPAQPPEVCEKEELDRDVAVATMDAADETETSEPSETAVKEPTRDQDAAPSPEELEAAPEVEHSDAESPAVEELDAAPEFDQPEGAPTETIKLESAPEINTLESVPTAAEELEAAPQVEQTDAESPAVEELEAGLETGQAPERSEVAVFSSGNRVKERFPARTVAPARLAGAWPRSWWQNRLLPIVVVIGCLAGLGWYVAWSTMAMSDAAARCEQAVLERDGLKGSVSGLENSNASLAAALARSEGLRFAVQSASILSKNPGQALLLAIESARRSPGPASDKALLAAWNLCHERRTLAHSGIATAGLSPDGLRVVVASHDASASIRSAATGEEIVRLKGHEGRINDAAFSPDGLRVVTGSADGTAGIWDSSSGEELHSLGGNAGSITAVGFSPDGWRVVVGSSDGSVRIWDAEIGVEIVTLQGHEGAITSVRFSSDGKSLVTASLDETARTWDAVTGAAMVQIIGHEGAVTDIDCSPDISHVVTASTDGTARIWEMGSGQETMTLQGHAGPVRGSLFCPNGQWVVTVSDDGTARLWDRITGSETAVLKGHEGAVIAADFAADGQALLTSSEDGTARIWDALSAVGQREDVPPSDGLLAAAEARMPRELTFQEKKEFHVWNPGEEKAAELVESLFAELRFVVDVKAQIEKDRTLAEPARNAALRFAVQRSDDPEELDRAAWELARSPGGGAESYRTAIRYAKAASGLEQENGYFLNTLGVAQYRAGLYEEALATLLDSDRLNSKVVEGGVPHDVAFIAMAHYRLGHAVEADATLGRARTLMEEPQWAANERSRPFLDEAEALISGSAEADGSGDGERIKISAVDQPGSDGD